MPIERVDDPDDPRVEAYRDARDPALRDERGLFLVESRLCVERLVACGRFAVHSLLVTDTALRALRGSLEALIAGTPVYVAPAAVLRSVVGYALHRGCIAAAERGDVAHEAELLRGGPTLLVGLEGVANPENVGGVFRNAAAFGADAVLLSRECADPLYRKAIRVSMAATLTTPFARVGDWPRTIERLRAAGLRTAALAPASGAVPLRELSPAGPHLLLLGAEGEGLRPATLAAADVRVHIPMHPAADSLNVATASGIALHHLREERLSGPAAGAGAGRRADR